jgi:hypothetical protein
MDMTAPRAARPFNPATARPTVIERIHGPRLALDQGSQWTHRGTGETFTLTGRRRAGVYLDGLEGASLVSISDLLAGYTWAGCNHGNFCCSTHGEHSIPHRGCILR